MPSMKKKLKKTATTSSRPFVEYVQQRHAIKKNRLYSMIAWIACGVVRHTIDLDSSKRIQILVHIGFSLG